MSLVTPEGLAAIPGLGNPIGHSPALANDGRLAFTDQQLGPHGPTFRVRLFDPVKKATTTLLTLTVPPSSLAWGPAGQLALLADTGGDRAHLLVLDRPNAKPRKLAELTQEAFAVMWPSWGGYVVVLSTGDPSATRALVLDASGKQKAVIAPEWRVLGLMADGALIAVSASHELVRLAAPAYDVPESFGTFTTREPIWQVVA